MAMVLRWLVVLIALAFLAGGLGFALAPTLVAADFAVTTTGVAGMGTLRADLGGLLLGNALFAFAGLRRGSERWLAVPLVFIATILALRLLHLALDGTSPGGIRSLIIEIVVVAILFAARRAFAREAGR
jgi:hypothetical protein